MNAFVFLLTFLNPNVPNFIPPDKVPFNHEFLQVLSFKFKGAIDLCLFLRFLFQLLKFLLGEFMPVEKILDDLMSLVKMVVVAGLD